MSEMIIYIYACETIQVNKKGWPTILKDKSERNLQKLIVKQF